MARQAGEGCDWLGGVATGGRRRVGPEAAGVPAASRAPESRRPCPRSCTRRCPRRHEPLQGVQVPAHGGSAAPPRGKPGFRSPLPGGNPSSAPGPARGPPHPEPACPRGAPLRPGSGVQAALWPRGGQSLELLGHWALVEHRGPASQRDPRGGAARLVGPRPEAYEAACLPGFRSASPGSHSASSPPPRSPLPGAGVRERCSSLSWPWRVRVCHWRGGTPRPEMRASLGFPPAFPLAAGLSSSPTQGDAAKAWVGRGKPKQVEARERAESGGGGVPRAPRKGRRPDEGCASESMPAPVCSETLFGRPGSVFQ